MVVTNSSWHNCKVLLWKTVSLILSAPNVLSNHPTDDRSPSRTFLYVYLAGVEDHLHKAKKAIDDVEEIMKNRQRDLQDEFIAAAQSLKSIDDEYTGAGGKSFLGV